MYVLILGSAPVREVFLVMRSDDDVAMGQLINGRTSIEHNNLLGPVAVDSAERALLYFDKRKCIQRCSLDQPSLCKVNHS